MAEWRSGPSGTRGSCLQTRYRAPESCLEDLLSSSPCGSHGCHPGHGSSPSSLHRPHCGYIALFLESEKVQISQVSKMWHLGPYLAAQDRKGNCPEQSSLTSLLGFPALSTRTRPHRCRVQGPRSVHTGVFSHSHSWPHGPFPALSSEEGRQHFHSELILHSLRAFYHLNICQLKTLIWFPALITSFSVWSPARHHWV